MYNLTDREAGLQQDRLKAISHQVS